MFAILPVLRNTMLGLDQVDKAGIEAGRGMGLSKRQALLRIESAGGPRDPRWSAKRPRDQRGDGRPGLPHRGWGLGETIGARLALSRNVAVFVGAPLVALLALFVDWIAALAERFLRPKGL